MDKNKKISYQTEKPLRDLILDNSLNEQLSESLNGNIINV